MAALRTLEKLTDRKTCLNIIEQNGAVQLSFKEYPHENSRLIETREKVNMLIKEKGR